MRSSWSFARAPTYCLPAKVIKWEEKSIHWHAGVRNNGPPAVLKTLLDLCRRPELAKVTEDPHSERGGRMAIIVTLGRGLCCFFFPQTI